MGVFVYSICTIRTIIIQSKKQKRIKMLYFLSLFLLKYFLIGKVLLKKILYSKVYGLLLTLRFGFLVSNDEKFD